MRVPTPEVYSEWRYNSIVSTSEKVHASIFRPERLPSLSRLPVELGREHRFCERCGKETVHILYRVPKKMLYFYVRNHPKNVHATCLECAKSTIVTGEERERALSSLDSPSR
jgi:hypothetical protein